MQQHAFFVFADKEELGRAADLCTGADPELDVVDVTVVLSGTCRSLEEVIHSFSSGVRSTAWILAAGLGTGADSELDVDKELAAAAFFAAASLGVLPSF